MSARVYVGRIPYRATERDLKKFFRDYGRLAEIIMKNGFAFVDFEDARDAEDAVRDLNGKELMGVSLSIDIARGTPHGRDRYNYVPPPPASSSKSSSSRRYRVIVENISSRVTSRDLKKFFSKVCDVVKASANEKRKNEGYVELESSRDVDRAFDKLDGTDFEGRKIRLVEEKRRNHENGNHNEPEETNGNEERPASRSLSRSASPRDDGDHEFNFT
uniref:RRM domain-containing protein n=1 Tax=Romanomermis culicivorax TaxID=13658 RepID=A0A915IER1_ROMCU